MQLDDITISRAITESFIKDFLEAMDVDVAIGGAGPSGMTAAYYLAKEGVKTVVFERNLRLGGGMPGWGDDVQSYRGAGRGEEDTGRV